MESDPWIDTPVAGSVASSAGDRIVRGELLIPEEDLSQDALLLGDRILWRIFATVYLTRLRLLEAAGQVADPARQGLADGNGDSRKLLHQPEQIVPP